MCHRSLIVLAVTLFLPFAILRSFPSQHLEVTPSGEKALNAQPGKPVTVGFTVTNRSSERLEVSGRVIPPAGWRLITTEFTFSLRGGESDVRLVSLSVPAGTVEGSYDLRYEASDPSSPLDTASTSVSLTVAGVRQLELIPLDAPRYVVAGAPYTVSFKLTNRGNSAAAVHLETSMVDGFQVQMDSSRVVMQAQESRIISLVVTTPADLREPFFHGIRLSATSADDSTVTGTAASSVDVIPGAAARSGETLEFPLYATFRGAGERGIAGAQIELGGRGAITEKGHDRLDLLVRTPDIQHRSFFGLRDEYRVEYQSPMYHAFLGDRNFMLSPLTEFGRYAFGGGGSVHAQTVTFGGFYNLNRFSSSPQKQAAAFFMYTVEPGYDFGLNYLHQQDRGAYNIVSARGLLRPIHGTEADVEYGLGFGATRDNAWALQWRGYNRWASFSLRYVRASPGYQGYYRDVDYKTASVTVFPVRYLRLDADYRDEKRNLDLNPDLRYAPRTRYYQIGMGYSEYAWISYRVNEQSDLLPTPQFQRLEQTLQLRSGYSWSDMTVVAEADLGTEKDKLLNKESPFQRFILSAAISPSPIQQYSFSTEYENGRTLFSEEKTERLAGTVRAALTIGSRTHIALNVYASRTLSSQTQTYSTVDLEVGHRFPFGHVLTLHGRETILTPSSTGPEFAYMAEYTVPFALHLGRTSSTGGLHGKVRHAGAERGLAGAMLFVDGILSVTDADGEFSYPTLTPGPHVLQVDAASVGLHMITNPPTPLGVEIIGGEDRQIEIALTSGASVAGNVQLAGTGIPAVTGAAPSDTLPSVGLANVILELAGETELFRRVTDSRGRFDFSGIPPGRWTLRLLRENLPDQHIPDRDSIEFTLAPGSQQEAGFRVLPRKRTIRMIEEGEVIQEKPTVPLWKTTPPRITLPCLVFKSRERSGYHLQVSSWKSEKKAMQQALLLEKQTGLPSLIRKTPSRKGGSWFIVQLTGFDTREEAEAACRKVHLAK